jgi:hypothetical protein
MKGMEKLKQGKYELYPKSFQAPEKRFLRPFRKANISLDTIEILFCRVKLNYYSITFR